MLNIVLLSHGHLASGMKNTIELIAGRQDNLFTYDAYVDGNNDIKAFLLDFLKIHLNEKVIVITDFLGGSVNNDAIECKNNYDFYVLAYPEKVNFFRVRRQWQNLLRMIRSKI